MPTVLIPDIVRDNDKSLITELTTAVYPKMRYGQKHQGQIQNFAGGRAKRRFWGKKRAQISRHVAHFPQNLPLLGHFLRKTCPSWDTFCCKMCPSWGTFMRFDRASLARGRGPGAASACPCIRS